MLKRFASHEGYALLGLRRTMASTTKQSPSKRDPEIDNPGLIYPERFNRPEGAGDDPVRPVPPAVNPSLPDDFPGLPELNPISPRLQSAPTPEITTLSNGIRVATFETYGQMTTLGLIIGVGTRHEPPHALGMTHVLERLAFKSTTTHTQAELLESLEALGGQCQATKDRDQLTYFVDVVRYNVPEAAALLASTITQPQLADDDLAQVPQFVDLDHIVAEEDDGEAYMRDLLCRTGYNQAGLGNPLMCSTDSAKSLAQRNSVLSYMGEHYVGENMVFIAAGYEHAPFVQMAEKLLGSIPRGKATATVPSTYTGGELFIEKPELKECRIGVGFEGVAWNHDDLEAVACLQALMGGGSSFSAGGPGKGMYSRVYMDILNQYYWCRSAMTQNACFLDSGIFGLYGTADPGRANNLYRVLCMELVAMANTITQEQFERARNMLKSSLLMNLEERSILFEDMGRQLIMLDRNINHSSHFVNKIDALTLDDLHRVARKILASPPTVVAVGEIKDLPKYSNICDFFTESLRLCNTEDKQS